jgi:gliding motility-associated-like protein
VDPVQVCLDKPPGIAIQFYSGKLYDYLEDRYPAAEAIGVYRSQEDALLERNRAELETLFIGPLDGNRFWYRLEQQNQCEYIAAMDLEFKLPLEIEEDLEVFLCNGLAELEAAAGFDSYLWEDGSTAQKRQVSQMGTYSVILTRGGCDQFQTFEVLVPQTFSLDEVRNRDFQDRNSIEIIASHASTPLRYSMDGGASFQESPRFENLLPGVYQIVVRDDCAIVERTVVVGGLPKFFTPNGDGQNDHWRMAELEDIEGYEIQVFDRYGNLVIVLDDRHPGWDGTVGGRALPASDYWYRLQLAEGRVIQGHFALRR